MMRFLKLKIFYFLLIISFSVSYSQELEKFFQTKNTENNWTNINLTLPVSPEKIEIKKEIDNENKSTCQYPNENIYPGKDLYPKISDEKRVNAILELIKKISQCVQLPFKEDGQVFKNKEGLLPPQPYGYYREYTLIVPKDAAQQFYVGDTQYTALPSYGARGPERLIIGGGSIIYYTPTHYRNFIKLDVIRTDEASAQSYTLTFSSYTFTSK